MATGDKNDCKAYGAFLEMIDNMYEHYSNLNPTNDDDFTKYIRRREGSMELSDMAMEFIRGAVVAVTVAWETYVHDLFEEAFQVVIDSTLERKKSLDHLQKQWPASSDIIKGEMKREADKSYNGRVSDLAYDLLRAEQTTMRSGSDVLNWREPESELTLPTWRKLLDNHCDRLLKKAFQPILGTSANGGKTIDDLFRMLFGAKESLSQIVVTCGEFKYDCRNNVYKYDYRMPEPEKVGDVAHETLCNVSCLYYGLRCVLVNGKPEKTLEDGVLKDFPATIADFPMPPEYNQEVKLYYVSLYNRILSHGRNVHLSYLSLLNLTRFCRSAAIFLKRAIAKWFYELQPDDDDRVSIWGYPPQARAS